jgi:3-phytase
MKRLLFLMAVLAPFVAEQSMAAPLPSVEATLETESAPATGDAADDPAIWIHPSDATKSLILGTNKAGGLLVFGMDGKRKQYIEGIKPNNVDVRSAYVRDGKAVGLAVASERLKNTLVAWTIDPETTLLTPLPITGIKPAIEVYGFCLGKDSVGALFGVITAKSGVAEQWRLEPRDGGNTLAATLLRTEKLPGQCEGCVSDDENGVFYIGEETGGVWKLKAAPGGASKPTKIADVTPSGVITPDVEGITLFTQPGNGGFLVVSSQGSNSFCIFERSGAHKYLGAFSITAESGKDPVTETDGVDVTHLSAGPGFEQGLLVVQDDENDGGRQNFKLVPWQGIAQALKLNATAN